MIVVRVEMWPGGDAARKYALSSAALWCEAASAQGRSYGYLLCKDAQFGGPQDDAGLRAAISARLGWRKGKVTGHLPGDRGAWDLLGAVLVHALGSRLRGYFGTREDATILALENSNTMNTTCYCVLWIDLTGPKATLKGAGLYSEKLPSSLGGLFPVVLTQISGSDYGDAERKMKAALQAPMFAAVLPLLASADRR